ncbi:MULTISPECIES: hypothetical protein [Tatumella]|uniref:Uncharacterized protein n=1 Tax=Tatumella punctata TaxID=399969 RepID=A0ABW1VNJ8_9GAMM|nr:MULTISPECIES: hypothetical protein [unclassified Tatumella]MBS0854716.1 hypothetical protein [Tatumella sp. JGM16]MBS0875987.1 hypothetical protein [Tatumella sp. JGM82]MBS0890392.1 hypothetical protein [Tatumella sp. JGM94]MBS0892502.1 hypothetical protein [Tatumella sp. JGM130]MBS0900518.1 hypothetical protein [Tatumella sp. JGM100]
MRNLCSNRLLAGVRLFLALVLAGLVFPVTAALTDAGINIRLQVVNRCAMSVASSADSPQVNVQCPRSVTYLVRVHQQAETYDHQPQYRRVEVSY